ncbi:MAG: hypothetical protein NVSMB17_09080 [Candidatus Dormibacteria bacterium]
MTINGSDPLDLDKLLDAELRQKVAGISGPSARVGQSAYHAAFLTGGTMTPLATLAAMASSKAAAGIAVATLAIGGGTAAVASATGSSDPAVWGKTVTAAVSTCKSHLAPGTHGIGECVSKVAQEKGEAERAEHSRGHGEGHGDGHGEGHKKHSTGEAAEKTPDVDSSPNPRGHDGDAAKHPAGPPTAHPSERPDANPSGHPAPQPSEHPTVSPSERPSAHPSEHPSSQPSHPSH